MVTSTGGATLYARSEAYPVRRSEVAVATTADAARPDRRATMADVGRLAGVSATTVSFVLNQNATQKISAETRQRVLAAIAELGYRPNRMARGLRTRRTATIGFVTDEIAADPFAGATILGAHEAAWAGGNLLLVVNTTRETQVVSDAIDELLDRRVDAIIFAVVGTRHVSVPESIKAVPTVLLNGYVSGGLLPSVLPDEVAGGHAAASMLTAAGHRKIVNLTGPEDLWPTRARLRGFRSALADAGVDEAGTTLLRGNFRADSGYQLTRDLVRSGSVPTGILCGNDRMAIGVYLALQEAGLRVPEDVSVVGYDDQVDLAADITPALSTIRMPYYQMGRWAAEQLLARTAATLPARTYLSCPVVPRRSVAPPRAGT